MCDFIKEVVNSVLVEVIAGIILHIILKYNIENFKKNHINKIILTY